MAAALDAVYSETGRMASESSGVGGKAFGMIGLAFA
jgi:hypothetical protein